MNRIYVIEKWYKQKLPSHGLEFDGYLPGFFTSKTKADLIVKTKNAGALEYKYKLKTISRSKQDLAD